MWVGGLSLPPACRSLDTFRCIKCCRREREERDGEGGQLEERKERKERGGRVIMSDNQSQADSSRVV